MSICLRKQKCVTFRVPLELAVSTTLSSRAVGQSDSTVRLFSFVSKWIHREKAIQR